MEFPITAVVPWSTRISRKKEVDMKRKIGMEVEIEIEIEIEIKIGRNIKMNMKHIMAWTALRTT